MICAKLKCGFYRPTLYLSAISGLCQEAFLKAAFLMILGREMEQIFLGMLLCNNLI